MQALDSDQFVARCPRGVWSLGYSHACTRTIVPASSRTSQTSARSWCQIRNSRSARPYRTA
jgi:hypothetical protein